MQPKNRSSTEILAANLAACMAHPKSAAKSQLALAKKSGIAQATIGRILRCETHAALDTIDAIAKVYGHAAWQLILPDLDCGNPQVLRPVSAHEQALYERLRLAAQEVADYRPK